MATVAQGPCSHAHPHLPRRLALRRRGSKLVQVLLHQPVLLADDLQVVEHRPARRRGDSASGRIRGNDATCALPLLLPADWATAARARTVAREHASRCRCRCRCSPALRAARRRCCTYGSSTGPLGCHAHTVRKKGACIRPAGASGSIWPTASERFLNPPAAQFPAPAAAATARIALRKNAPYTHIPNSSSAAHR